jgi:hypothetical protein
MLEQHEQRRAQNITGILHRKRFELGAVGKKDIVLVQDNLFLLGRTLCGLFDKSFELRGVHFFIRWQEECTGYTMGCVFKFT